MDINYEVKDNICLTPCPYNVINFKGRVIAVGSYNCTDCEHYAGRNGHKLYTVICNHPPIITLNNIDKLTIIPDLR